MDSTINTPSNSSILDLSQRPSTTEITNTNDQFIIIDNWNKDLICNYTDNVDDDLNRILIINKDNQLNIEQSLTDQLKPDRKKDISLSDIPNQSQIDLYYSKKKKLATSHYCHHLTTHHPTTHPRKKNGENRGE